MLSLYAGQNGYKLPSMYLLSKSRKCKCTCSVCWERAAHTPWWSQSLAVKLVTDLSTRLARGATWQIRFCFSSFSVFVYIVVLLATFMFFVLMLLSVKLGHQTSRTVVYMYVQMCLMYIYWLAFTAKWNQSARVVDEYLIEGSESKIFLNIMCRCCCNSRFLALTLQVLYLNLVFVE